MNLLKTMQEECPAEMKPDMTEMNISIRSLQNTIDKYKKLAQEQAQVIVQKEMLVKSLRSEITKLKQLNEEKTQEAKQQEWRNGRLESDLRDTKKRLKSEEENSRRWYHRYRAKEEELDKEKAKTAWEKFREKHHLQVPKKRYRSCYYSRKSFADWFAEKMLFPIGCVIFAVVVFAVLIHYDLIWYM